VAIDIIRLACPGCGAKLEVHADMDRFACGYCGNEVIVDRRGGTIALKAVADAIEKVQRGTDRTAQELTLARLRQERADLQAELKKLAEQARSERFQGVAWTGSLAIVGLASLVAHAKTVGLGWWYLVWLLALCFCVLFMSVLFNVKNRQLQALKKQLQPLEERINVAKRQLGEDV
jgi:ribosomal protein S27AE/Flp pilus assembly protein TadB